MPSFGLGDFFAIQEGVVQVAQVARLVGHGDLLGQAGAQGVGTGDDHAIVHAQLEEGVAYGIDLGEEVDVRNGDLAVLVAALLLVGHLVLDLDAAGAGFDHLLGQQVGRLGVAEAGVDVGDDRHHVGFEVVDLGQQLGFLGLVASGAGSVQAGEQQVQPRGRQPGAGRCTASSIRPETAVFSCMDWSGSGPKSERSAATIQPDR